VEKIADAFAEYFEKWGITLPEEEIRERREGTIIQEGWTIKYLFGNDERSEYLDFYATHRMTNDRHVRIRANGVKELLPSLMEFMVYSEDASDEEIRLAEREYQEHNTRVKDLLRNKGFI